MSPVETELNALKPLSLSCEIKFVKPSILSVAQSRRFTPAGLRLLQHLTSLLHAVESNIYVRPKIALTLEVVTVCCGAMLTYGLKLLLHLTSSLQAVEQCLHMASDCFYT